MDRVLPLVVASEAIASGSLTRRELTRDFTRVHQNVYARRGVELVPKDRAVAAWLWSGRTATVAGFSAAAVLKDVLIPDEEHYLPLKAPAELMRTTQHAPPGIVVHLGVLRADEVQHVHGIDCTTAARTAYDLGRRLPFTDAVIHVDSMLYASKIGVDAIEAIAAHNVGARGIRQLRSVLKVADGGAQSPQETRLRLLLLGSDLPRLQTQIPVGKLSIDMGWRKWKVGVEYDGKHHWEKEKQRAYDIDRYLLLEELGWRIVRVSAKHLRNDPNGIIVRSRRALVQAGCPI